MKVLTVGDWHGNVFAAEQAFHQAEDYECAAILHVGDFGYWEGVPEGVHFLNALEIFAEDADGIPLFFADGNHENHPLLRERYPMTEGGIRFVRPLIRHVERGYMINIADTLIQFFGGAWSINNPNDRIWEQHDWFRPTVEGVSWWPEEEPTHYDVANARVQIMKHGKPDVLITHDAPWSVGDSCLPGYGLRDFFPRAKIVRELIEEVYLAGEPELLVHGHYHHHYVRELPWGKIVGLQKETQKNANMLLDLESLSFRML